MYPRWAKSLSLGGGIPTSHSFTYHIQSVLCIFTFVFLSFFLLFLLCYRFPKHKKTKNISVVSLYLFLQLVCLTSQFQLLFKNPKRFRFVCLFLSVPAFKLENPKIFVVLLWFCKVYCRVQQSFVTPLDFGFHIYYSSHTSEKAIITIYDNSSCGERLV